MKALQLIIPPVYLLISLLLMLVLHYQLPLLPLIPSPYSYTGVASKSTENMPVAESC